MNAVLQAEIADEDIHPFCDDDLVRCCDCGDEIEIGDPFTWEPWEEGSRMVSPAHAWCSVRNKFEVKMPEGWGQ